MGTQHTTTKQGHLFTVEILIEEETNGLALETLVHLLNQKGIKDYRILNGMELGKLIELNTKKTGGRRGICCCPANSGTDSE
ncbi:hypothetical protein P7H16_15730 [Paenibacillus larvae]|nr:hypothetical protein [Paenibacillus larvae]MDT2248104.1 hypothetical protein [Paenibacillus larvae]